MDDSRTSHGMAELSLTREEVLAGEIAYEWLQHYERVDFLQGSNDPLHQILANIEALDGVICCTGQYIEDERKRMRGMIEALVEVAGSDAEPIVTLLEPSVHERLPTFLDNLHAARRLIAHARLQVQSYPALVAQREVPRHEPADFRVHLQPDADTAYGLDTDTIGAEDA